MFGGAYAVERCGIDIAHAGVPGGGDDGLALGLGDRDAAAAHRGGAEAEGGDLKFGAADLAFFPHWTAPFADWKSGGLRLCVQPSALHALAAHLPVSGARTQEPHIAL